MRDESESTGKRSGVQEHDAKGTVTLSIRLTEEQRDLLTQAAEVRGWTPTNLLRVAALEKASYIINTSTLRRLDFRGLAGEAARRLFGEENAFTLDANGDRVQAFILEDLAAAFTHCSQYGDPPPVQIDPRPMTIQQLDDLKRAAHYGGTEFLNMLVEACSSLTAPKRKDLPEPIDPGSLQ
jgi:hypothetical protein